MFTSLCDVAGLLSPHLGFDWSFAYARNGGETYTQRLAGRGTYHPDGHAS